MEEIHRLAARGITVLVSTHYNIVPGLMGVILTMTMIMMTALAVAMAIGLLFFRTTLD